MRISLAVCVLGCVALRAQIPPPTSTPHEPFFIKKQWVIGGRGNWDSLTLDPAAARLYIAHGPEVQVVDVESGSLVGTVKGLREAHAVALDASGEYGYVSDGPENAVVAFHRQSFEVSGRISLPAAPRALVLDPESGLLLAVSAGPAGAPPPNASADELKEWAEKPEIRRQRSFSQAARNRPPTLPPRDPCDPSAGYPPVPYWQSLLTLIDPEAHAIVAEMSVCGYAGAAVADGRGGLYVALVNSGVVLRVDAGAIAELAKSGKKRPPEVARVSGSIHDDILFLDWTGWSRLGVRGFLRPYSSLDGMEAMSLGGGCRLPVALAIDAKDDRLFAACSNLKMAVLNTGTGETVTSVPIGPGPDGVGYDAERGLIFTANGGAEGSVTVIRRDGTDSYNVVQTLATRQQARTLAVNASTGQVYLVTVLQVVQVRPPKSGVGTLELKPEDRSFQVLVVGN